eukprot:6462500-Amphidinium_carterae.1
MYGNGLLHVAGNSAWHHIWSTETSQQMLVCVTAVLDPILPHPAHLSLDAVTLSSPQGHTGLSLVLIVRPVPLPP